MGARMFWPMNRFAEWMACSGSVEPVALRVAADDHAAGGGERDGGRVHALAARAEDELDAGRRGDRGDRVGRAEIDAERDGHA